MGFHLAAYYDQYDSEGSSKQLPPVTDMFLPSTPDGFLLPSPMKIVAAYVTSGSPTFGGIGTLTRAAITAPSLRRVAYPYIRPASTSVPEKTDPNVMNLVAHPITIPASESVGVLASIGPSADGGPAYALLWLCDQLVPAPPGEAFVLRFQATSSAMTVGAWSAVGTISFDQSLPPGAYTVIGFEHWCQEAVAARLVFPGSPMRPGTLSVGGASFDPAKRTDRLFYEGGLGCYGIFNSFAPPSLEVLANYPDTEHEGYLTVIRTGDAGV
jgi:hypothetical protein